MINVTRKALPHSLALDSVANPQTKKIVMQLNENIKSLKSQLEETQKAIQELQRR